MANNSFSVVLPTYSGMSTLDGVLASISHQDEAKLVEIVIVIDGPSVDSRSIVDAFAKNKATKFKNIIVEQFSVNKGRFDARYEGAKLANGKTLIFIDDRTEMTPGYLKNIFDLSNRHVVIISNIVEDTTHANFVSNSLSFIRNKVYKNWGKEFSAYEITEKNFDKSPKGTAGLCVKKSIFIDSAVEFIKTSKEVTTNSNDDTKLLKLIMKRTNLYRSAKPKLIYIPRNSAFGELVHIYKRGPMFIDYYLDTKSPYFTYLVSLYVATIFMIVVFATWPLTLLLGSTICIILMLTLGLFAQGSLLLKLKTGLGLLLVPIFFIIGIYYGTVIKIITLLKRG